MKLTKKHWFTIFNMLALLVIIGVSSAQYFGGEKIIVHQVRTFVIDNICIRQVDSDKWMGTIEGLNTQLNNEVIQVVYGDSPREAFVNAMAWIAVSEAQ